MRFIPQKIMTEAVGNNRNACWAKTCKIRNVTQYRQYGWLVRGLLLLSTLLSAWRELWRESRRWWPDTETATRAWYNYVCASFELHPVFVARWWLAAFWYGLARTAKGSEEATFVVMTIAGRPLFDFIRKISSCALVRMEGWEVVLWSFKPGTYQTGFKLAARGPVSSGPLVLPLMIEILAPLTASTRACLCHVVIDEVWLAFPQWRAISSTQRNARAQELWRFRKSSRDNRCLAIPSPSDLRHKK